MTNLPYPCRSILFVPGNRPERFDKALYSGADMICVDLEDALLPDQKSLSRDQALEYVSTPSPHNTLKSLRINPIKSVFGLEDLLALSKLDILPTVLLIPKVNHRKEIQIIKEILGDRADAISFFALLETPEGIANATDIANQENVDCLLFGSADWSAECNANMSWDTLLAPRSQIVQAAAQAGIIAMDGAWLDFNDDQGLKAETIKIARMGFVGKPILHPKQLQSVHDAFRPSKEAVEKAQSIITALESTPNGVLIVDGRMVDKPLIIAAQRTLKLSQIST